MLACIVEVQWTVQWQVDWDRVKTFTRGRDKLLLLFLLRSLGAYLVYPRLYYDKIFWTQFEKKKYRKKDAENVENIKFPNIILTGL